MPKIVVSYRRSDSAGQAGRIYDHLQGHFGQSSVFMDVDAIPFGTDFRAHIRSELLLSDILLAVIGPRWFGVGPDGVRRIDDEADPVRVEVETALKNGIAVVPVLIDGTPMPGAGALPEALKELAFLNAAPVDMGRDFRAHMDRLTKALGGIIESRQDQAQATAPRTTWMHRKPEARFASVHGKPGRKAWPRLVGIAAGLLIAAGLGAAGWYAFDQRPPQANRAPATGSAAGSANAAGSPAPAPKVQPAAAERPAIQRSKSHGTFAWHELWTTDAAAAQAFYRRVIGWDAQTRGAGDAAYTILSAGQVPVAGIATLPAAKVAQGARPDWVGYVSVTDVDASTTGAKDLGATVYIPPTDVAGIGRYSLIADPQGAYIVLFKGVTDIPVVAIPRSAVGYSGWRELSAADQNAALSFYERLFGWTKADGGAPLAAGHQLFAVAGMTIGDVTAKPASVPVARWTYFFQVENLSAATSRIEVAGGKVLGTPAQLHDGSWTVQAVDPQGAVFALLSPNR